MTDPTICDVFDRLDKWRHFPNYQLERRADIYFAMFLPDVLGKCCGTSINPIIIPEFPLKKDNNQSKNPDYFALSADCKRAFLIELKTDIGSVDHEQITYLSNASGKELRDILCDLKSIIKATDKESRKKYFFLFQKLAELDLIDLSDRRAKCLQQIIWADRSNGLSNCLKDIEVRGRNVCPEVIYILPNESSDIPSEFTQITFKKFANAIKEGGEIANRFGKSLIRWVEPAGSQKP